jgi:dipeptidyl aminopeptidase/acylaminoacyl peptidase
VFAAEDAPLSLPAYETIPKIENYSTRAEYETAKADTRFTLRKVPYTSGELKVFAYVYGPAEPSKKLPVVIFNRGSYTWTEFAGEYLLLFRRLAEAGFLVIAPMYRGSGGAEGRDEMGGADLDDLFATTELVRRLPNADSNNVFMYGESRGGMMTYQAIRDAYPLRAAAVFGAFSDMAALTTAVPRFGAMGKMLWPDYDTNRKAIETRRSAVQWAERLRVPLLIMHGGKDRDVPPAQALSLATKLQEVGLPYELIIRAGASHSMSQWRAERDAHAIEWFRRHMSQP